MIKIKRAYEPYSKSDGYRVLVDRLWPRGVTKEDAHIDKWLKEVSPSTSLRKWFGHDPEKWEEFSKKYKSELRGSEALKELKKEVKDHKKISLIYAAKDEEHNNAVVILDMIKNVE